MNRLFQLLLICSFITLSWLGFMVVHEFGHVVTGWVTGASVSRVILHPLQISWTAFTNNPHPQLVAWGGPILGSLLPLGLFAIAKANHAPGIYLFRFFAGFCLTANGFYLIIDAFERGGDGGTLLRHGAMLWHLVLFGSLTTPTGFWLWNGIGKYFGLGRPSGTISHAAAFSSIALLALVIILELAFYRR
jgi:hypothetical protein